MSIEKNILNYFKQIKKKGPNLIILPFFYIEKYFIEYLIFYLIKHMKILKLFV
jgi:hypothetical protein